MQIPDRDEDIKGAAKNDTENDTAMDEMMNDEFSVPPSSDLPRPTAHGSRTEVKVR